MVMGGFARETSLGIDRANAARDRSQQDRKRKKNGSVTNPGRGGKSGPDLLEEQRQQRNGAPAPQGGGRSNAVTPPAPVAVSTPSLAPTDQPEARQVVSGRRRRAGTLLTGLANTAKKTLLGV